MSDQDKNYFTIFSDGGARGNPGDAAYGWLLFDPNGQLIQLNGKYIGVATNNLAEYTGILEALKYAKKNKKGFDQEISNLKCVLDSELIVKQLNKQYKVKNQELKKLYIQIQDILKDFEHVEFTHVRRENNIHADKLVNIILNAKN
jgi:ribonuclease HI